MAHFPFQPIKIIFDNNGESPDIRYIGPIEFCTLEKLKQKIIEVYQLSSDGQLKITWVDKDGDHITICSDGDLGFAMTQMNDNRVYHVSYKKTSHHNMPGPEEDRPAFSHVLCDVCENQITGYRYKCLECSNYDLCSTCEGAGNHSEHIFLRLPNCEIPMSRYDSKILFSAARDLKKTAYAAARRCHRAKRDFIYGGFKGCKKDSKCEKDPKCASNQESQEAGGCPFTADVTGDDLLRLGGLARDHLYPILQAVPEGSMISDIIRNATEAVFGALSGNTAQNQQSEAPSTSSSQTTPTAAPAATSNVSQPNAATQEKPKQAERKEAPEQTEMEWTIVNNSQVPPAAPNTPITPNAPSSEKESSEVTSPPQPGFILHPDPIIARGLGQLYEMGFSNEGDMLVTLLKRFNGNVSEVVKTICNMS